MDYIELNKKNTEILINMTGPGRLKLLEVNRYTIQLDMLSKYIKKDEALLDIGVRDGAFLNFLRNKGYTNLYAIDIYERSIEITKGKGFDCEVIDVQHMDLDKVFDVVVMSHVLEHCPEPKIVLNNVYKHMNPNGILFIEVPIEAGQPKPTEKDAHYFNFHSLDELLKVLGDSWELLDKFVSKKRIKVVLRKN